jgi:hypothetical protein
MEWYVKKVSAHYRILCDIACSYPYRAKNSQTQNLSYFTSTGMWVFTRV